VAGAAGDILVLNAGSSSIKFALFDGALGERHRGIAAGIGGDARLVIDGRARTLALPDHRAALTAVLEALAALGVQVKRLRAAGHRVVHGGAALTRPVRITAETLAAIRACVPLAPLHNPHNLAAIEALAEIAPGLPQFASFDTAFHASNPEVAVRYAIPRAEEARGIRRYGFHGLSYSSLVARLPEISGAPLPRRLLAFHLGNGASACAILEGRSVATTMGYSPLDGLPMGTRAGSIDATAVLRMVEIHGLERTQAILNHDSGLKALSGGISDMRKLLAAGTPEAAFAVEHFCYWTLRHAGSLIMAMGGVDAVAFTGGIGENAAPIRACIAAGMTWLGARLDAAANAAGGPRLHAPDSAIGLWVVPAEEERVIAADALALLGAG
jgi:acetate kinase